MFVLSFPPLFGNEIVHVLCGIVWGLWIGFGIVCAGTFLGEVGNFYAFRYICQARGEKLERTNLSYGCLARVVRDGGFLVGRTRLTFRVTEISRLGRIDRSTERYSRPLHHGRILHMRNGHLHILPRRHPLPPQTIRHRLYWRYAYRTPLPDFPLTPFPVVLYESAGVQSLQQRIISGAVLSISLLVTIFAAWWILNRMNKAKPAVLAGRRKVRAFDEWSKSRSQMTLGTTNSAANSQSYKMSTFNTNSTATLAPQFDKPFNYSGSSVDLPLSVKPQKWDSNGRAILDTAFHGGADEENQRMAPPAQAPDIRITRASGASSLAGQANAYYPQAKGYDNVPLTTPTQTRPNGTFPPGPSTSQPPAPQSDDGSNESGPQWAGGVSREDEKEVKTPLTSGMKRSDSAPFQAPRATVMTASASAPSAVRYDDPYEDAYGGHTWEPTDATFHTAQGSEDDRAQQEELQRKQALMQQQQMQQQRQQQMYLQQQQQQRQQQMQMQQQQYQQQQQRQYPQQQPQQYQQQRPPGAGPPQQYQQQYTQQPQSPQQYPNQPPQQHPNPNPHQQDPSAASSVNVIGSYPQASGR